MVTWMLGREMEEYNTVDVLSMEELFWILRPWSKKLPNVNHYHNEGYWVLHVWQ